MAYRNLEKLHERIKPYMLRRRKADVETELPERTDRNFFVPLSSGQQGEYEGHEMVVARFAQIAKRRPLTQLEQDKLLRHMAMMRMVCDTNYILNPEDRVCPKLAELEKILEECRDNPEVKVIIFSEWERMLHLVRELCQNLDLGFAWHTGSVPQQRRRAEINLFKSDPNCRIFLSTDSGATGLNLQNASVVINCDLPWNPAKLEQRIARAWRKHQTRPVTVINLVSENTIEHRMLETLAQKQALADGVLDHIGNFENIKLRRGQQAFLEKLQQFITPRTEGSQPPAGSATPPLPADRPLGFATAAHQQINGALVRCEERYPAEGSHSVLCVVVERDAAQWREKLVSLHQDYFPPGQTDPLAPVRLEVIERATDEAIDRLVELGLVSRTNRATRPVFPLDSNTGQNLVLSEAERQRADEHRQKAGRKIKMATLLGEGGLAEEARAAILDGTLHLGKALAVETRIPEPADVDQALLPPLAQAWSAALIPAREFVREINAPWKPIVELLQKLLSSSPSPSLA
jgi:hypothetical protein